MFKTFINVCRVYFVCLGRQKPYYFPYFVSGPQHVLATTTSNTIKANIYCVLTRRQAGTVLRPELTGSRGYNLNRYPIMTPPTLYVICCKCNLAGTGRSTFQELLGWFAASVTSLLLRHSLKWGRKVTEGKKPHENTGNTRSFIFPLLGSLPQMVCCPKWMTPKDLLSLGQRRAVRPFSCLNSFLDT